jgi:RNA polymerase sigma factor (sigma-70 family)
VANAQLDNVLGHLRRLASPQAASTLTDPQLLERFLLQHDQSAFAALVKRHGPLVQRVCWRVLHHAQDVEDAFQATFLVLARHAGSIRKRQSLASWLHGAAYRTALRAKRDAGRRQHHEREAPRMPSSQPPLDLAWRELQALLDAEIAHLPEKYRAVFVLCCLESKSKAEAAGQLGLKAGTVSSRLAHARKILQQRLTRRGLTLSAVLAAVALSEETSRAALSPVLVRATTQGALAFHAGGAEGAVSVSNQATILAEGVSKTMFATKCKSVGILLLAVILLTAGAGVLAQRPGIDPQQSAAQRPAHIKGQPAARAGDSQAALSPALEEKDGILTLRGRVLDPAGKPCAGAEISIGYYYAAAHYPWFPPIVKPLRPKSGALSGADGRFHIRLTEKEIYATVDTDITRSSRSFQIVAAAKGYGPAWAWLADVKGELTLRLAKDDVPIEGRVVDLQGRPVAGASVGLDHLTAGKDYLTVNSWAGLPKVTTDKAGRFRFTGVGRDRTVYLNIAGPTIEHKRVGVVTRSTRDTRKADNAQVEVVAGPIKPIEGTIRAKDTGKPLAGVEVFGNREAHRGAVRAVTDKQGRYRLVGLPKAKSYHLEIYAPAGQNYLGITREVGDSEALKPNQADFSLRRGVAVRFRLIDKATGKPVRGTVFYTPLANNLLLAESEIAPGYRPTHDFRQPHTPGQDHYVNFIVYPGPGVLFAWVWHEAPHQKYLPARLTEADKRKGYDQKDPANLKGFLPLCQGYRIVDTDKTDQALTFTIEIDPGGTVKGYLVGPDFKPLKGATAAGLGFQSGAQLLKTEAFTVLNVDPQTERTIAFLHKDRKLIGHRVLRGDKKGPLLVRLQPWGTLTGRILDDQGKPVSQARVRLHYPTLAAPGAGALEQEFRTDRQGRFRVEGLMPGLKHALTLRSASGHEALLPAGPALKDLSAETGGVKKLGDIQVKAIPAKQTDK